jgi:hypothetical protein
VLCWFVYCVCCSSDPASDHCSASRCFTLIKQALYRNLQRNKDQMLLSAARAAAVACFLACLVLSADVVAGSWSRAVPRKPVPPAPKPPSPQPPPQPGAQIKKPLHAGYVPISRTDSSNPSSLYYAYWEASTPQGGELSDQTPITLWLQGGPGCASSFGALYELGPTVIDSSGGKNSCQQHRVRAQQHTLPRAAAAMLLRDLL